MDATDRVGMALPSSARSMAIDSSLLGQFRVSVALGSKGNDRRSVLID